VVPSSFASRNSLATSPAVSDRGDLRVGPFGTFGRNALAAYVLHDLVAGAASPYVPRDAPDWSVAAGFLLSFGISYGLVRGLEKQGVFIKL
jgi:hypothetical protein